MSHMITRTYPVNAVLKAIEEKMACLYQVLANTLGCGPFDGGCVVVALAIQRLCGGKLVVLIKEDNTADHACVYLDGRLVDFENALEPAAFIPRFNKSERAATTSFRPMEKGDLPDVEADALTLNLIIQALTNELDEKA